MQRQSRRAVRQVGVRCQGPQRLLQNERCERRREAIHEHRHELEWLSVRRGSCGRWLRRLLSRGYAAFTHRA